MLTRTTTAMLDELADPANQTIWHAFDARYRPILVGFARRLGLPAEDAADLAQETLVRFVRAYREGKYERGRGRLTAWIIGMARNGAIDFYRRRGARPVPLGLSAVDQVPGTDELEGVWEVERERAILRRAVESLREESSFNARTVRVFELIVLLERTPAAVAEELGMTMNDVYLAKHRCLKRLRSTVSEMTSAYERDQ